MITASGSPDGGQRDMGKGGQYLFRGWARGALRTAGRIETRQSLPPLDPRRAQPVLLKSQHPQRQAQQPQQTRHARLITQIDGTNAQMARLQAAEAPLLADLLMIRRHPRAGAILPPAAGSDVYV